MSELKREGGTQLFNRRGRGGAVRGREAGAKHEEGAPQARGRKGNAGRDGAREATLSRGAGRRREEACSPLRRWSFTPRAAPERL